MNKQTDITDRTRQTFIDAFCLLYKEKPFEKITVQEITRKAGYNRSTFYQYFFDLNDLLDKVENELLDYIVEKRENAEIEIHDFVNELVSLYETKEIYINALFGEYGSNRFLEKLKRKATNEVPGLNFSADSRIEPYLMEFRFTGALSLFRLWLQRGQDLTTEELLALIGNLYSSGISFINNG